MIINLKIESNILRYQDITQKNSQSELIMEIKRLKSNCSIELSKWHFVTYIVYSISRIAIKSSIDSYNAMWIYTHSIKCSTLSASVLITLILPAININRHSKHLCIFPHQILQIFIPKTFQPLNFFDTKYNGPFPHRNLVTPKMT